MSGGTVPYHLRQNKAIDRNLFVQLLLKLNRYTDIESYTYISFGGPFLEDFKIVHASTGISKMISLEEDENVLARQTFNMPLSCIECLPKKSGDFILEHTFTGKNIIWLDYASPRQLRTQLVETEYLITQLHEKDVLKITLNANANSLADFNSVSLANCKREMEDCRLRLEGKNPPALIIRNLNQVRFDELKKRVGDYLPNDITEGQMQNTRYPEVLCKLLKQTIQKGMQTKPNSYFQPLTAYVYADSSHTMLTYTGIILPSNNQEIEDFFKLTGVGDWDLGEIEGEIPVPIMVPALSIKERIKIDSLLPENDLTSIKSELNFLIDEDEASSERGLENYIKFYRQYPYFSKISV